MFSGTPRYGYLSFSIQMVEKGVERTFEAEYRVAQMKTLKPSAIITAVLLEVKGVLLFLTLMKVLPGRATDQPATLKRIRSVTPPANIRVQGVYFLFGRFDAAIVFEAPDLRAAKDFVLRAATPIYRTETLSALPAEEL